VIFLEKSSRSVPLKTSPVRVNICSSLQNTIPDYLTVTINSHADYWSSRLTLLYMCWYPRVVKLTMACFQYLAASEKVLSDLEESTHEQEVNQNWMKARFLITRSLMCDPIKRQTTQLDVLVELILYSNLIKPQNMDFYRIHGWLSYKYRHFDCFKHDHLHNTLNYWYHLE